MIVTAGRMLAPVRSGRARSVALCGSFRDIRCEPPPASQRSISSPSCLLGKWGQAKCRIGGGGVWVRAPKSSSLRERSGELSCAAHIRRIRLSPPSGPPTSCAAACLGPLHASVAHEALSSARCARGPSGKACRPCVARAASPCNRWSGMTIAAASRLGFGRK